MSNWSLDTIYKAEAGWYCGDFHAHTTLSSDGYHPPEELVALATEAGMDFVSFTDHNNIAAIGTLAQRPSILVIPGCEITLKEGHYNIFGVNGWQAWMEGVCDMGDDWVLRLNGRSLTDLVQTTAAHGYLNSINHPLLKPWAWEASDTPLALVNCLEIMNDPTWPDNRLGNPAAIAMWTRWLNAGYRISAIGGTDYHGSDRDNPTQNYYPRIHKPHTYVYAQELSMPAILTGIRKGWAYVSMGPRVSFTAMNEGQTRSMGDELWVVNDSRLCFTAQVQRAASGSRVRLVKNGVVLAEWPLAADNGLFTAEDAAQTGQSAWYRLDVVDATGSAYQVVTNPIYVEPHKKALAYTFGDFLS